MPNEDKREALAHDFPKDRGKTENAALRFKQAKVTNYHCPHCTFTTTQFRASLEHANAHIHRSEKR